MARRTPERPASSRSTAEPSRFAAPVTAIVLGLVREPGTGRVSPPVARSLVVRCPSSAGELKGTLR